MEIPTPVCELVRNDNVVRDERSPLQIPIYRTTQRYRAVPKGETTTHHVRHGLAAGTAGHDLAARPAGQIPISRSSVPARITVFPREARVVSIPAFVLIDLGEKMCYSIGDTGQKERSR